MLRHRAALALAVVMAAAVLAVTWAIVKRSTFPGDLDVKGLLLHDTGPPHPLGHLADAIGGLGLPGVAIVSVLVLAGVAALWLGPRFALLVFAAAGVVVWSTLLKDVLGPSPLQHRVLATDRPSYPSGHTAYATALFGLMAVLALSSRRRLLAALAAGVVVAMGPARVVSGAHWVSDVVGGYALGIGWLACVLLAGAPWAGSEKPWKPPR